MLTLRRGSGFTVIELLVVVIIIGLLAAMLLPTLQQRREAARQRTCIFNQQQILNAIGMYMAQNDDTLPPGEHRPEVLAYFNTGPGGRSWDGEDDCHRARQANPYLRWPVILEEYVGPGNRDRWQCPSAAIVNGATWIIPDEDWLYYVQAHEGAWGSGTGIGPCNFGWPRGWGGTVTDSIAQARYGVPWLAPVLGTPESGAFVQSIATIFQPGLTLAAVPDPSGFVIIGDGGVVVGDMSVGTLAYPEICCLECSGTCVWVDWECGILDNECGECALRHAPKGGSFLRNLSLRVPYSRHRARFMRFGPPSAWTGVNVGFLDGHVEWLPSESVIAKVRDGEIDGVGPWGPVTGDARTWEECFPGGITIY